MKAKQSEPRPEDLRRGATLRALREANLLTINEVSVRMGISHSHLCNLEAGRRTLTPPLARRAADVLGCRPIALLRPDEFPAEVAS